MYPAFVAEGQEDAVEKEAITEQDGQVVKALTTSKKLTKDVEVADIGCGFGGLLMALAPTMPDTLCLGQSCRTLLFTLHTLRSSSTNSISCAGLLGLM